MTDEPTNRTPMNIIWVLRYGGRLVYLPHENISHIVSNIGYNGQPLVDNNGNPFPIRVVDKNQNFFEIQASEDSLLDMLARTFDLSAIVESNEAQRALAREAWQAQLAQAAEQGEQEEQAPEQPAQQQRAVDLPQASTNGSPGPAVPDEEDWNEVNAQPLADTPTPDATQKLIDEVAQPAGPPAPPLAGRVRRRNGNRK